MWNGNYTNQSRSADPQLSVETLRQKLPRYMQLWRRAGVVLILLSCDGCHVNRYTHFAGDQSHDSPQYHLHRNISLDCTEFMT